MIGTSTVLLGSTLLAGIAAAAWGKVRMIFSRITSLAVVTMTVEGWAARAIAAECWSDMKRSPFGNKRYNSQFEHVRPTNRTQLIAFERLSADPVICWRGWRPLLVGAVKSSDAIYDWQVSVSFIRGTWDADQIVAGAVNRFNQRSGYCAKQARFYIRRFFGTSQKNSLEISMPQQGGSPSSLGTNQPSSTDLSGRDCRLIGLGFDDIGPAPTAGSSAIDALALSDEATEMVEQVRRWLKSERWYKDRSIPWTRGALLHGAPGTGKSSLVRAIAQDFDLPVFVFDLSSMTNQELTNFWQETKYAAPCIALFEDFDAVFHGRVNRVSKDGRGLTFDCFLNCLSGIEAAEGVFKVVTTNDASSLDEALGVSRAGSDISTRPGRLDYAIELPALTAAGRRKLAKRILADTPDAIERIVFEGDGDTGAQFTERCTRMALSEKWSSPTRANEDTELAVRGSAA